MAGRDHHHDVRVRESNNHTHHHHASNSTSIDDSSHRRWSPPPSTSQAHQHHHASISAPIEDSRHRRRSPQPSAFRTHLQHHASISTPTEDSRHRRWSPSPSTPRTHHHQPNLIPDDRFSAYQREIQALRLENQRLLATHIALKQELALSEKDLRQLASAAEQVKTARDAEVRAVLAKTVKIEAEYNTIEGLMAEVMEARKEVKRLKEVKEDLGNRLRDVTRELEGLKPELAGVRTEMESLAQDLQKGRSAIETERKTSMSNNEYGQVMERSISALRCEIQKLQAELANAEKKAAAANPGAAAYAVAAYGNSHYGYGEGFYPDNHYGVPQAQGGIGVDHTAYNGQGSAIVSNGPPYGAVAQVHQMNGPA